MRQPGLYSEEFTALDLAVEDSRLHLWKNRVHGPAGISHSLDKHLLYQQLTHVFLKTITEHNLLQNVSRKFCLNPRDLAEPNLASSVEWISDQPRFGCSAQMNRSRNQFAFRLWFKSTSKDLVSRILLLFITKQPMDGINPIRGYQGLFGNVDLMVIPSYLLTQDRLPGDILTFTWHQQADINQLSANMLVSISRYLDHGQLLNLGELHQLGCRNLGSEESMASIDPYQQYFHDFNYNVKHAPNGCLMKVALPSSLIVLHQTAHKPAIIESNEMRISRAGCMGNMVYTTLLSGNNIIGGHAIGLYERSHPGASLTKDDFILFQVNHLQNRLTNWIEKLGRGRLFLDARNRMLSSQPHTKTKAHRPPLSSACAHHAVSDIPKLKLDIISPAIQDPIERLSNDVISRYANFYPLLAFVNLYGSSINKCIIKDPRLIPSVFSLATQLINKNSSHYFGSNESVINNIFFETIKDYILLFQSDVKSNEFKALHSFYMGNVYSIFFELHPELKLNWNTGSFPIQIDHVIDVLTRRNIITPGKGEIIFKKFFLDRLAYYIQVCCLEGCLQLPTIEQIKSFDDLANTLPNFAGILFNDLIKSTFKKTALIEQYSSILRSSYDESYDERNIDVAIKCGASWTEEFGIRSRTSVRFFDFKLSQNRHGFYSIETQQPLGIVISGISETNGFTTRFSSLDKG